MFGEGKTTEESKLGNETISCSLPVLVVRMDMDRNWTKLVQLFFKIECYACRTTKIITVVSAPD